MGAYQPSSLVDYRAGREVEFDTIWGEPLRRAGCRVPSPDRRPRGAAAPKARHPGVSAARGVRRTITAVQRVEFTIEPFVEAQPGPHVTAPVDALTALGFDVDVGPFGSGCEVASDQIGNVVATIVRTAIEHGATHVNVDVSAIDEATSAVRTADAR